jgi:hypothetical protein
MATLLELYGKSDSATISVAKAMGTADAQRGVDFFDGQAVGPFNPTSPRTTADKFQTEFSERKEGANVTPAALNNSTYELSRWTADALKIAFDGVGPAQRPKGYFNDVRFKVFNDSAGRMTDAGSKLHQYAPLTGKQFAGGKSEKGVNTSAHARVVAGATSTGVGGLVG